MTVPLLTTKLYLPPPRPQRVDRSRLRRRLTGGLDMGHRLTLVSAPAGFGKTTLLSAWAAEQTPPTHAAWLSLDAGDNDPARALAYIVAALQTAQPEIGQGVQDALGAPQLPPLAALLTPLVNAVAALPSRLILVLDDYHVIERRPVHDALTFLLDHLPNLHLVLSTRADPPLPLARLRARGQLTELRAQDLRFTPEEAAAFLNQIMGLALSPEDIAALETRTEGWIAGLQMAALSLQHQGDKHAFIAAFAGDDRYVADYLVEEVLRREPPAVQTFLLETAILDRLNADLCDAVTQRGNSQALLNRLANDNLFLVPLDHRRQWFRYHHLFADLLRQRLQERYPGRVPTLHRRACTWHRARSQYGAAVQHALSTQDLAYAADVVEAAAITTIGQGRLTTVQNWLDALPTALVRQRSYLCVSRAWTLNLTRQIAAIEPCLQDAERALATEKDTAFASDLRGQIAAIRAYEAYRQNDVPLWIKRLRAAQEQLAPDNLNVRTAVSLNLGRAYTFTGDLASAANAFREAQSLGQASDNKLAGLAATGLLALAHIAQGQLARATALCREALDRYQDQPGNPSPALCHVLTPLGLVHYERDERAPALAHLTEGVRLGDQIGYGVRGAAGRLATAALEWARRMPGDHNPPPLSEPVRAALDRMPADLPAVDLHAQRVRLWLAQGNLALATRWAAAYQAGQAPPGPWPIYADLALARVWAAQGEFQKALGRLQQIRQSAEAADCRGWLIQALTLKARLWASLGESERAMTALDHALTLAEPQGYVRTFVDEGAPLARLLYRAAQAQIHPDYSGRLLAAFPTVLSLSKGKADAPSPAPDAPAIEPLSERESQVLQLIAQGLSNREIAAALHITAGTVKGHAHNIYGKLGVSGRIQAAAQARTLGLLPPPR